MKLRVLPLIFAAMLLSACQENEAAAPPSPVAMTNEAVGYYCQMDVLEHSGPKAQIHLAKHSQPIWFAQVRDAIAYTRLPEETAEVTAVYVHDMGAAESWQHPGTDNWVNASEAYFVLGSTKTGGMGAPEAVPFAEKQAAETFIAQHGGQLAKLSEIPDGYVLAPVNVSAANDASQEGVNQ
ncbi:MAG: nitrous oxide reductase accessory protein NosL [Hyphomicrobiales bacterium]